MTFGLFLARGRPLAASVLVLAFAAVPTARSDLLEVLLESGKVLSGLRELAFLHALAYEPVDKGSFGVHEVELVVDTRIDLKREGGRMRAGLCAAPLLPVGLTSAIPVLFPTMHSVRGDGAMISPGTAVADW